MNRHDLPLELDTFYFQEVVKVEVNDVVKKSGDWLEPMPSQFAVFVTKGARLTQN